MVVLTDRPYLLTREREQKDWALAVKLFAESLEAQRRSDSRTRLDWLSQLPFLRAPLLYAHHRQHLTPLPPIPRASSGGPLLPRFPFRQQHGRTRIRQILFFSPRTWFSSHAFRVCRLSELVQAICHKNTDRIKALLAAPPLQGGACIDHVCPKRRMTPLSAAVSFYPDAIDLLVEAKANLHAVNDQGRTALHTAVLMGNLESMKKLVRLAPQLLTAQTGRIYGESDATPAGLAEELKHVEVARYLHRNDVGAHINK